MTLSRIRHLLALATNPTTPVEEARTAAMLACKAIAEQKLLDGAAPAPPPPPRPEPGRPRAQWGANVDDAMWRAVEDMFRTYGTPPRPAPRPDPPRRPSETYGEWEARVQAEAKAKADAGKKRAEERARAEDQARTASDPKAAAKRAYAEGWDRVEWKPPEPTRTYDAGSVRVHVTGTGDPFEVVIGVPGWKPR